MRILRFVRRVLAGQGKLQAWQAEECQHVVCFCYGSYVQTISRWLILLT